MNPGGYSALRGAHNRIIAQREIRSTISDMTERRSAPAAADQSRTKDAGRAAVAAASARRDRAQTREEPVTGRLESGPKPAKPTPTPWGAYQAPSPEGTMHIYRAGPVRGARIEKPQASQTETPPKAAPALGETLRHAEWRRITTARVEADQAKEAAEAAKRSAVTPTFARESPQAKKPDVAAAERGETSSYRAFSQSADVGAGDDI